MEINPRGTDENCAPRREIMSAGLIRAKQGHTDARSILQRDKEAPADSRTGRGVGGGKNCTLKGLNLVAMIVLLSSPPTAEGFNTRPHVVALSAAQSVQPI